MVSLHFSKKSNVTTVAHQNVGQYRMWRLKTRLSLQGGVTKGDVFYKKNTLRYSQCFKAGTCSMATVSLCIKQAESSRCETVGKRCTCENNQSQSGLTEPHDLERVVITCQSHLAACWVLFILQCT